MSSDGLAGLPTDELIEAVEADREAQGKADKAFAAIPGGFN